MENRIASEDLAYIYDKFTERDKIRGSTILVTGCAGFLGFYLMQFFNRYAEELQIKSIIGLDNFKLGKPGWVKDLENNSGSRVKLYSFDVVKDNYDQLDHLGSVSFVVHMASIASPVYYRKYPLETVDANVWGLRKLLERYKTSKLNGFLYFSSSEIYGDPFNEFIPTTEEYRGNVATMGPRACYDEAKRFCETLCYLYNAQYNLPISIVRPFNNYGPGMKLDDRRVPAAFAKSVLSNEDIQIHSDGTPTRTFCYVADAIVGYLKTLVFGRFDFFNIGMDQPEISIRQLAAIFEKVGQKILEYKGSVKFCEPTEKDFLTHNPSRRCPNIEKARRALGFSPTVTVDEGVERFLKFTRWERGS